MFPQVKTPHNDGYNLLWQDMFPEHAEIIESYATLGFRETVLVASTAVDEALIDAIRARLDDVPAVKVLIDEPMAPLSSFSSHIHLAHALGLIDPDVVQMLNMLRKIRNACAHEREFRVDAPHIQGQLLQMKNIITLLFVARVHRSEVELARLRNYLEHLSEGIVARGVIYLCLLYSEVALLNMSQSIERVQRIY
jgi:hypothetical protein